MDPKEAIKKLENHFGSRESMLMFNIVELSLMGQPCDVTFWKQEPLINVKIDQQLGLAMMYGAGPKKIAEMMSNIKFSDGSHASAMEIWTVNPMPKEGFTDEELAAVDLTQAEEKCGPNGETMRKMISDTYHCKNSKEEDHYLRRFIAS